jgi:hypothetical protein
MSALAHSGDRQKDRLWVETGSSSNAPHQIREVVRRRHVDGESLTGIARSFNVNHTTIMRIVAGVERAGYRGA